jgi:hypothetical protein
VSVAEEKSDIAKALEERAKNRPTQIVDGLAFTGPGSKIVGSIAMRVASKQEENAAVAQSAVYLKDLASQAQGAFDVKDPRLAVDADIVHILHAVCRDPRDPANRFAFTTPREMMRLLTREEVAKLFDIYVRFKVSQSPYVETIEVDVEREVQRLHMSGDVGAAELDLQSRSREWLEQFCARLVFMHAHRLSELEVYRALDGTSEAAG